METQDQTKISVLSIEEILKIDIIVDNSDIDTIRSIFNNIDAKYHHKILMLCSFIMDVQPEEVIATNIGKAPKRSRNIFLARAMWLKILKDEYSNTFKEIAVFSNLTQQNVQKSIFEFEQKLKFSCILNSKYNTVIKILKK